MITDEELINARDIMRRHNIKEGWDGISNWREHEAVRLEKKSRNEDCIERVVVKCVV